MSFEDASKLETIGEKCFWNNNVDKVKKITFPGALKRVGKHAFNEYLGIDFIIVQDGCPVDVARYTGSSGAVIKIPSY